MEVRKGREAVFPALSFLARVLALALLFATAGCGTWCHPRAPGERMVRTELYFGLARAGSAVVTEAEWADFLEKEVTLRFPAGLTVQDARGQWRNAKGETVKEPSKVLVIFHGNGGDEGKKLEEIRDSWKKRFGSESVLRATSSARVSF